MLNRAFKYKTIYTTKDEQDYFWIKAFRLYKSTKNTKNNNFGSKKAEIRFIGSLNNNKWVG